MKRCLFILALTVAVSQVRAQHFFYLRPNQVTNHMLEGCLKTHAQFVAPSILGSDFILESSVSAGSPGLLKLDIRLLDSLTLQTVYRASEEYHFGQSDGDLAAALRLRIGQFIEQNMGLLLASSRSSTEENRFYGRPAGLPR